MVKSELNLTMTARGILGILWQAYPHSKREEQLEGEIERLPDADKELEYLREKGLVTRVGVPSPTRKGRLLENMLVNTGAADPHGFRYLHHGYKITAAGVDAFREEFPPISLSKIRRPQNDSNQLNPSITNCQHQKAMPYSVQSVSTNLLGANLHFAKAEKSSSVLVMVFYCPDCKATWWKEVTKPD